MTTPTRYSMAHRLNRLRRHVRSLGLEGAARHLAFRRWPSSAGAGDDLRPLRARGYDVPIWARRRSSDVHVFEQVFISKEYALVDSLRIPDGGVVVDCGANVGYASIVFLTRFPTARVVAVEPDPANASLCRKNLLPFGGRATVVESAVWSGRTGLRLVRPDREDADWGVSVEPTAPGEPADLQAVGVADLMADHGLDRIDLLKVDIEGAERQVFADAPWLDRVRNLVFEPHGDDCEAALFRALDGYRYDLDRGGELLFCSGIARA